MPHLVPVPLLVADALVPPPSMAAHQPFKVYSFHQIKESSVFQRLPAEQRFEMEVITKVLPFRVNSYVLNHLIDWNLGMQDPIFRLVFPHRDMLRAEHFDALATLLRGGASADEVSQLAAQIRQALNPHPAEQRTLNVPVQDGVALTGVQHKYDNTVLFFPTQGQTCHSYCTFCFRWPQFIGDKQQRFGDAGTDALYSYLRSKPDVSDLLLTGGDPMIMRTARLQELLRPLREDASLSHIKTVRIGTKSLTFWPQRFVTDSDADELLALMADLVRAGKHVALMAHINHGREMESPLFAQAVARIRATGAVIRSQAPLLAHINDDPRVWAAMWEQQVAMGIQPYYMFVERDTGAKAYFEVPLARAHAIYAQASSRVSGLARTARGPSMSCGPGKVEITGIAEIRGERVFVLNFLQGRNRDWVRRPFFAKFDPDATWFDQLVPAFGEQRFFFSDEYDAMLRQSANEHEGASV